MIKIFEIIKALFFFLFAMLLLSQVKAVYGAENPVLAMEAESGILFGNFEIGSDSAASGGKYVHLPNGNEYNKESKIIYKFNLISAGTYRIKSNVYAASIDDDSFFVKVNGNPTEGYLWDVLKNTSYRQDYVNNRKGQDPVEITLQPGPNTVTVLVREDGTRLDRIELELVQNYAKAVKTFEANFSTEWYEVVAGFKLYIGTDSNSINVVAANVKKAQTTVVGKDGDDTVLRFDADISFPAQRVWFALSAYNINDSGATLESDKSESVQYNLTSGTSSIKLGKPTKLRVK